MKRTKYKVVLLCILTVIVSNLLVIPAFAADTNQGVGEGIGVSSQPPILNATYPGEIGPSGVNPPDPSNETIVLGTYNGNIVWASGVLYTDKWVRTSGTTIKLDATFGQYNTQQDAIDRTNAMVKGCAPIPVTLIDSKGKHVSTKQVTADKKPHTISFTVTANEDYYLMFGFRTGFYHSGPFKVYK